MEINQENIEVNEKPPVDKIAKEQSKPASIEIHNGVIVPKNIEDAYRYATLISKSGLAPKQFDSPEKILIGMQQAQELGLPPLTALKSMYIINGTPALFGDLPLALVQKSGHLEYITEKQYDDKDQEICSANKNLDAEVKSAVCKIKRKGQPETERSIGWEEAKRAGLDLSFGKEKITYKNFRKRMLQMRARSIALKDMFPDVLMGISIQEYDEYDNKQEPRDVTNKSILNELLDGVN